MLNRESQKSLNPRTQLPQIADSISYGVGIMPDLSGAELKSLLYIIRRTFGFKKQTDTISINQMLGGITKLNGEELDRGTGLSKPSLLSALRSLADRNIIIPTRQYDAKGGNMATEYGLNVLAGSQPPRQRGT